MNKIRYTGNYIDEITFRLHLKVFKSLLYFTNCGFSFYCQVALLKKRVKGVSDGAMPSEGEVPQPEGAVDSASPTHSPSKEQGLESEVAEGKLFMCQHNIYI